MNLVRMSLVVLCLVVGSVTVWAEEGAAKPSDAAVIAAQKATYPLKTCVVSGEKLGEPGMEKVVDYVYQGRLVELCCGSCIKKFNADTAKYLKLLDEAAKNAGACNTGCACMASGKKECKCGDGCKSAK